MTVDIKSTIELSGERITPTFLAKTMGRPHQTIHNWMKGGIIPRAANDRLISIFKENGIEPLFLKN